METGSDELEKILITKNLFDSKFTKKQEKFLIQKLKKYIRQIF